MSNKAVYIYAFNSILMLLLPPWKIMKCRCKSSFANLATGVTPVKNVLMVLLKKLFSSYRPI